MRTILQTVLVLIAATACAAATNAAGEAEGRLALRISWGHVTAREARYVKLVAQGAGLRIEHVDARDLEAGEELKDGTLQTTSGGGDVDALDCILSYPTRTAVLRKEHSIWSMLLREADAENARRLKADPAFVVDPPVLTVRLNPQGTKGFSVSVGQLLANRAIWVPSLDLYLSAGERPLSFAEHQRELDADRGSRILDRIHSEPEANYGQFTRLWHDMGDPAFDNPSHVVGLTWDSAVAKFGVDRQGSVRPDLGNPDHFAFAIRSAPGEKWTWKGQSLTDGLPLLRTVHEQDKLRYELEQCAYPLNGPPAERRGDMVMVLLQKLTVSNSGPARRARFTITHTRETGADSAERFAADLTDFVRESKSQRVLLAIEGGGVGEFRAASKQAPKGAPSRKLLSVEMDLSVDLLQGESRQWIIKLPSPPVEPKDAKKLSELTYSACSSETMRFWKDHVSRGARFRVPEKVVNDLFTASLWHAMRLPRRHSASGADVKIDLPYSNFAYGQNGAPWPVNQAVYVDYMLYDLRGYHAFSAEELAVMYRNQQTDGRIAGYANWGVYTPSMVYATAQHYLLSDDRESFEKLLPATMRALDWCLGQVNKAAAQEGPARGLVKAPLNDGTGEGTWAFNQAYVYAAFDRMAEALARIEHPRAEECRRAAAAMRDAVERGFGAATVNAPIVQMRDGTWMPYVPCEVNTPRRLIEQWYPTDVDTGAVHLLRLGALPADSPAADWLLNDHEDNLFLKSWGMANEPVYNQQAMAYLRRDDAKAAIRAFYSYMACAFSHRTLEPVEHRWGWGQYFGPPSTDGAWFELYRNMLIREVDADTLLLCAATPRAWLEDGKSIDVDKAPTYLGPMSFSMKSDAKTGGITARVRMPQRRPRTLLVRVRHPEGKAMRAVTVNGENWSDFEKEKEWVRIRQPRQGEYVVAASY